jgi:hypothetical protein
MLSPNHRLKIFSLTASVVVILPFLVLCRYNLPSSDDFYDYMLAQKWGVHAATAHYYWNWSGRFATHLLTMTLNPLRFGMELGGILTALTGIGLMIFCCWNISVIHARVSFNSEAKWILFPFYVLLFFAYLPFPNETIYWFTGTMAYMPGLAAIIGWIRITYSDKKWNKRNVVLAAALSFFIGGSNEINIFIFSWILCLTIYKIRGNRLYLICSILLFSVAAILELSAPGSKERMRYFTETAGNPTADFGWSLRQAISYLWHILRDWTRSTPLILIAVVLPLILPRQKNHQKWNLWQVAIWLGGLLVFPLMLFPFYYGTGQTDVPGRLVNVLYLCIALYVTLGGSLLLRYFTGVHLEIRAYFLGIIWLVLFWQSTYSSRWRGAVEDLRMAERYRLETTARHAESVKHKSKTKRLILMPIYNVPYTIFFSDLSADSSHWYNEGYAHYYGLRSVSCAP